MPRLPTANNLSTVTMRPATGVAGADLSAPYRATQQLVGQVTDLAENVAEHENKLELGQAQSAYLQGKIKTVSDFQHDNDFGTIQQRYDQQMQQLSATSTDQISSSNLKAQFGQWVQQQNADGRQQIDNLVWNKQRDHNLATTQQLATDNMNAALSAKDEQTRAQFIDATNNAFSGLYQQGYVSESDYVNMRKNWGAQYAQGSLMMMTPEQRISALQSSSGFTQFIPAARRFEMSRDAASESLNTKLSQWQLNTFTGMNGINSQNIDADSLLNAQIKSESNGQHTNPDGTLITSEAGARGIAQIMPDTGKNPGLGVKPLQNDSEQEHLRFQRDYMNALLNHYSGNQVLSLAAYNAGIGTVDQWVKQIGDPRGGQVSNEQFASAIPTAETKNYVYNVIANAQRSSDLKSITGSPEFNMLDGKQKSDVMSKALQVQDQQASVYRFNIQQRMSDDIAKADAGVAIQSPVSESEFMLAMPAMSSPAERAQYYQQWQKYQSSMAVQPVNQFVIMNSADAGIKQVESLKPDLAAPDFEFKQAQYLKAQQNLARVINQRESDPGGWLEKNSVPVQNAFNSWTQNQTPESGTALAQAILSEKQRLGIRNQDILPDSMIKGIAANLQNNQEHNAVALQQLAGQFGPYSDKVIAQLQKTGGSALRVVSAISNPDATSNLWTIRNAKTDELRNAAASTTDGRSALDKSWTDAFSGFASTLSLQAGGAGARSDFDEQGKRLTYLYASQGKANPAQLAATQLLSQYEIHDTWRLNKTIPDNAGLDWRDIQDGGSYFVSNLKESDINPASFYEQDPRLNHQDNTKIALDRIKNSDPQWVTSPNEKGLALTVDGHYVAGNDGKPLVYSFADLDAAGKQNRSTKNRFMKWVSDDVTYSPTLNSPTQQQGLPYANSESTKQYQNPSPFWTK